MEKRSLLKYKGVNYLLPFILVTICFALWGFANDITNPMVKAFSKIFRMSVTDGTLIQVAFYGGYFAMAFPAALFISRFTYKAGIVMGLVLYLVGILLFFPAKEMGIYAPFLLAYFIMTCGLSFLETSANPYILSMGDEESSTRRLNLAQAFNPIGSFLGMFVAMNFIQAKLNPMSSDERAALPLDEFEAMKSADLDVVSAPYIILGGVILLVLLLILFSRMPKSAGEGQKVDFVATIKRLVARQNYREGVIAQLFYVGAQIMCWTFIIQYGTAIFMNEGMGELEAEVLSQKYNIVAMILFCVSRFICTYLMKFFSAKRMLTIFGLVGAALLICVIMCHNIFGLYALVGVSACMSLMFPTIYGIALKGMGDDAKFGGAGLVMAILGGSIIPPLQARIIDSGEVFGMPATNFSFVLPLICLLMVALYGYRARFYKKI